MKLKIALTGILIIATSCQHGHNSSDRSPSSVNGEVALKFDPRRGSPAEYDAGAPAESKWGELFGSTPNYRSIGIQVLKGKPKVDEKFRWVFGPMWYRGRLTPESVKVFVVGQEGAQDENVSNRAFTGSTGTRVQKFLNHLGIYRSYLFLNTFVYTINGQLEDTPEFKWIEQAPESPIVEYRHKLFDYMLETNTGSVALFMGVGRGGKASLATWINQRGGKCSPAADLKNCDTSGMIKWFEKNRGLRVRNDILAIGVPHPGGANPNLGGADALMRIQSGFTNAANRVAAFKQKNPSWLKFDPDEKLSEDNVMKRISSTYKYSGYAPVPFRDFAFNTNWRMGSVGTTSNRWGADSIQVFSDDGTYNDKSSRFSKNEDIEYGLNNSKTKLVEMAEQDVPYESPRYSSKKPSWSSRYDFGPCGYQKHNDKPCELAQALVSWPSMESVGIKAISHPSLGYFGTYRGRAKGAKVFVLADQTSHDDFFSTRAISGADGQRLQSFLQSTGTGLNYFILRTLPVDTLGVDTSDLIKGATNSKMISHYKRILKAVYDQSDLQAVIALGPVAKAVLAQLDLESSILKIDLDKNQNDWKQAAKSLAKRLGGNGEINGQLSLIPREDLPFHTRWWMGSTGDRAARGEGQAAGNYYRVWAPRWVSRLGPVPLTAVESKEIQESFDSSIEQYNKNTEASDRDDKEQTDEKD